MDTSYINRSGFRLGRLWIGFNTKMTRTVNMHFIEAEDHPAEYKPGNVWVVGSKNKWVMSFLCPCGCGDEIHLNMLPGSAPRWKYYGNKTMTPSVNRTKGCRSHFTITGGLVKFHGHVENR